MTVKIGISLPDHVEQTSRAAATQAGLPLSTWIAQACEREAYRQGMAHDATVIDEHRLLADDWAQRQVTVIAALKSTA